MRRIRAYVDTSVFGGLHDEEFSEATQRFFDRVHRGEYVVLVSQLTADELTDAPPSVQAVLEDLPSACVKRVSVDEESLELAMGYIDAGAIGLANLADAIHVAAATVARADLIVSWNFRHLVNVDRIRVYNAVNLMRGYPQIEIHSPLELEHGHED